MKSISLLHLWAIFFIVILSNYVSTTLVKSNLKLSKLFKKIQLQQDDLSVMWNDLFNTNRGQTCQYASLKTNIISALRLEGALPGQVKGKKSIKSKFAWIKRWGYDESAYLFDYLDPVFQNDVENAFKNLYDDVMSLSNKDTDEYKDPFDIKKLITADNAHNAARISLSHLNKNYDPSIYNLSVNSVQLREGMKKWAWYIDSGTQDYAINFIMKYDINGDGRLNPRELILGTITHNKNAFGSGNCLNCFIEIAQKLDALFMYMDCDNNGFLSAEELWNGLPKLNRPDSKYNIFGINNSNNIRTSAINDFIIKNGIGYEGSVSKEEFRNGILYGYWDRQTNENAVIMDDSRTLKYLRWTDGGVTDTIAYNYMKDKVLAELIAKSQK